MVKKKWYENDDLMQALVLLFGIIVYWLAGASCIAPMNQVGWGGKP
jgi:hypothetical protein